MMANLLSTTKEIIVDLDDPNQTDTVLATTAGDVQAADVKFVQQTGRIVTYLAVVITLDA